MSSQYTIALVLGLVALVVLTYNVLDRRVHAIALVVSTGIYRGTPVAVWHRQMLLQLAWVGAVGAQIFYISVGAIGWWVFGDMSAEGDIRLLAYLMSFFSVCVALGWMMIMPFWYIRLARVLRQAEAD
jgi:uncharacterized membrane protein YciS (DUF1049 family)